MKVVVRRPEASSVVAIPRGVVLAIGEVGVGTCLLCADPAGRIVDKESFQEIEAIVTQNTGTFAGNEFLVGVAGPFGEGRLEIGEAGDAGPVGLTWGA